MSAKQGSAGVRNRDMVRSADRADAGATRIAAVQMASGPRVEANLREAARLI